jgi:hypothetical protein
MDKLVGEIFTNQQVQLLMIIPIHGFSYPSDPPDQTLISMDDMGCTQG